MQIIFHRKTSLELLCIAIVVSFSRYLHVSEDFLMSEKVTKHQSYVEERKVDRTKGTLSSMVVSNISFSSEQMNGSSFFEFGNLCLE